MLYYTYYGVPINQVSSDELQSCLDNGIEIISKDSPQETTDNVYKQIEIELYIRRSGISV
jgi:hypothetical protein